MFSSLWHNSKSGSLMQIVAADDVITKKVRQALAKTQAIDPVFENKCGKRKLVGWFLVTKGWIPLKSTLP